MLCTLNEVECIMQGNQCAFHELHPGRIFTVTLSAFYAIFASWKNVSGQQKYAFLNSRIKALIRNVIDLHVTCFKLLSNNWMKNCKEAVYYSF